MSCSFFCLFHSNLLFLGSCASHAQHWQKPFSSVLSLLTTSPSSLPLPPHYLSLPSIFPSSVPLQPSSVIVPLLHFSFSHWHTLRSVSSSSYLLRRWVRSIYFHRSQPTGSVCFYFRLYPMSFVFLRFLPLVCFFSFIVLSAFLWNITLSLPSSRLYASVLVL